MKTREEKIQALNNFSLLFDDLYSWCENAVAVIYSKTWSDSQNSVEHHLCWKKFNHFDIDKDCINIETLNITGDEYNYRDISIPVEVYINDNIEDYADELLRKKLESC